MPGSSSQDGVPGTIWDKKSTFFTTFFTYPFFFKEKTVYLKSKVIYLKRHSEQNIENHEGKILYIYNSRRFSTTFFGELRKKTSIKTNLEVK